MKQALLFFLAVFGWNLVAPGQPLPTLIPYLDGHKWGYADSNGRVVIKPQWRDAGLFQNGRASVSTEDSHGIIDTSGVYIIPPYRHWNGKNYKSLVGAYYNARGRNGKHGIIDSNNRELLPCLYDETESGNGFTQSGYFKWNEPQNTYAAKVCKNGKFGIVDTLNRTLIPFEYDGIEVNDYSFSSAKYYVVKQKEKMGLINAHNRVIIPVRYSNILLDKEDDNQIMLITEETTVLADTNGKIVHEVPGFALSFMRDSLLPVKDRTGKMGLMNYRHQLILPCEYLDVGITHDTVVLSNWMVDSNKKQAQHFKYYDIHARRDLSGWLTYQQYRGLPEEAVKSPEVLNKYLPHLIKMHVQGKDVFEHKIGDFLWSAIDYPKWPERLIPVRGIAKQDSTARYAAIIDTNGNYIVAPQLTNYELRVINAADSLIIIQDKENSIQSLTDRQNAILGKGKPFPRSVHESFIIQDKDKGSRYSIADFRFKTILPFQQSPVIGAFYYNDAFYAITKYDTPLEVYSRNFRGVGPHVVHNYTCVVEDAEGKPLKGLRRFKLLWFTDSNGYRSVANSYDEINDDGFKGPFKGCFMAEDSNGKRGFVTINGDVLIPSLSFEYYQISRKGPGVFLVDNKPPKRNDYDYDRLLVSEDDIVQNRKGLYRGLPYLVDKSNKVLLDSLTVDYVVGATPPGAAPLYCITLKKKTDYPGNQGPTFLMNDRGKGYFGNMPGNKEKQE
jgi:hypothetical protein